MSEQNIKQICHEALKLYLLNSEEQFIQWIFRKYVEEQSQISFNFINEYFPEYMQHIPDENGRRKNIIKIFNFFLDYYARDAKKWYKRSSPQHPPPIAGFFKLKARIPDFEEKIKNAMEESQENTKKWNRMLDEQKNSGERGKLFKEYERSINETLELVEKLLKTSQTLRKKIEEARNAAEKTLKGGGKKKQTGGDNWMLLYAIGTLLCFILCWQINRNIKSSILRHERIVNFNINKFKKEVLSSFPSMIGQIGEMQSNPMSCNYIEDSPQTLISHEGEEKNPTRMPPEMTNIQRNMKTGTQTKGTEQPEVEEYHEADEAITPEMLAEDDADQEQEAEVTMKSFLEGEAGAVSLFNVRALTDAYKCWGTNVMQAGFRDLKKHGNDIMEATRAPDDIIRNDEFENAVEHVAEAGMAYVYPGASFAHHTGNVVTEATGGLTEGAAKLAAAAVSFERATTLIKTLTNEGKGVVWDLFKYGKFFIISEHVGLTLLSAGLEQYRARGRRLEIVPFNFQPQHPGVRRAMQAARHNIASLILSSMWRSGLYTLDNHLIPSINYMYRILHAPEGQGYPTREEYSSDGTVPVVLEREESDGGSAELRRVPDKDERERDLADKWHGTGYVARYDKKTGKKKPNHDSYGDLGGGRKKTRKRRKKKSRKKKMKRKKKSRKKRKKKKTRKRRRKH
tara:strand:+ start:6 stop:2051 length:2046 start_codon:yes stop_codon:yes gene_type:complete